MGVSSAGNMWTVANPHGLYSSSSQDVVFSFQKLLYATVWFKNKKLNSLDDICFFIIQIVSFLHILWNNMHCLSNNCHQWHNLVWRFLKGAQASTTWMVPLSCTGISVEWVFSHSVPRTCSSAQTCPVSITSFNPFPFMLRVTSFEREQSGV